MRGKAKNKPRTSTGAFLLCSLGVAAIALVTAELACGYALEGQSWPAGSTVPFQLSLGNAGRTLIDGNTSWDTAAAPAPNFWNTNVSGLTFVANINPSASHNTGDGVNSVFFASNYFGQTFGSGTLAVTYYTFFNGRITEADVILNINQNWDSYRGPLRYATGGLAIGDVRRVLIHEMGHALGLDHPDAYGQHVSAVMNSVVSDTEAPTADDISGAQSIYGGPNATPTPTASPSPTPTPTPTPAGTPTPTPSPSATPSATPVLNIVATPAKVRSGGTATFTVTSSVPTAGPVVVSYGINGNTSMSSFLSTGPAPGTLTIAAGSSSTSVSVTVFRAKKKGKLATMYLTPGTGYSVSYPSSATVIIAK